MEIKDLEKFILYLEELKKELDLEMKKNTIMKTGWILTRKIDAIYKTKIYLKKILRNKLNEY
jgi:hypothetical protein